MTSDLLEAIDDWLRGEREGTTRKAMIAEITRLAKYNDAWPHVSAANWNAVIDYAIRERRITETNGVLRIAVSVAVEPVQLELF